MDLPQSTGRNNSVSVDPAPPSSPDLSDDEVDLRTPNDEAAKGNAQSTKASDEQANEKKEEKAEDPTTAVGETGTTTTTVPKLGRMDSLKSKWNQWSTHSNEYLSKKKESIAKSVKENASKLRLNLDHNLRRHSIVGQNGQANSDNKLGLPELRERMRQTNRALKRAVMEKCYQDFDKKLFAPSFSPHVPATASSLSVDDPHSQVTLPAIPGHADIAVEFSSIFQGEYTTAFEAWKAAIAQKDLCLVKEILFETIMTCYYFMIREKAHILKKHNRVDGEKKVYSAFVEFEKNYAKNEEDESCKLCHAVVNEIYDDIEWLYFEYSSTLQQDNEVENVTKLLIAKSCEVIWYILCSETNEATLLLYPLEFEDSSSSSSNSQEQVTEWSEVESEPEPEVEKENAVKRDNAVAHVSFPALVHVTKSSPASPKVLCKAKIIYL